MNEHTFIPNLFQEEALIALEKAQRDNIKSVLVVMPTGTGKTYLAANWFRLQLDKNPKAKLLFTCHNQDILTQANNKEFVNCLQTLDISTGYYNRYEKNIEQVTFATIQTLTKNIENFNPKQFDFIIVDEAHHYRAQSYEKAIKYFTPSLLMGLTATPNRMDKKILSDVFGEVIYTAKISEGIKAGTLCKLKYHYADNDIDFSDIEWNGNNYNEKDLNRKLCVKKYDDAILKEYRNTIIRDHNKSKTIAFCATVEHAYRMEKLFIENGIKAVALTGKYKSNSHWNVLHKNKRENIITGFKNGKYDVIFVRDLFNEGVDIPDADSIMMLRATQSNTIFIQQLGRGLRTSIDKPYLLVIDFTGNCNRNDINTEVLNEIVEIDIKKSVKESIDNKERIKKEFFIYNNGCEVRLNKTKIDLFKDCGDYTNKEIINKISLPIQYIPYNILSLSPNQNKVLGFIKAYPGLNQTQIAKYVPIDKSNLSRYLKMLLNDNYIFKQRDYYFIQDYKTVTKDKLIKYYFKRKEELGRQPRSSDFFKDTLYTYDNYKRCFGSWNNFLKENNEPLSNCFYTVSHTEKELLDYYYSLKADAKGSSFLAIQHIKQKESKIPSKEYLKYFRNWKNLLLYVGDSSLSSFNPKLVKIYDEPEDKLIENYLSLKNKNCKNIFRDLFSEENGSRYHILSYLFKFGSITNFLKSIPIPTTIIRNYVPKTKISAQSIAKPKDTNKTHLSNPHDHMANHKYSGGEQKDDIRSKVISKINDNDTILILESPELSALNEIESQHKQPKKIIIPNNFEFDDLANQIKDYKTSLNIEIINTSSLQYLVDNPAIDFDFIWLDYCGAFTHYTRDLDIVLNREIKRLKLVLTYNVTDFNKQDDSYYFANVISYVLEKLQGKNKILLMKDISQRYKKNMYSIGFDITS